MSPPLTGPGPVPIPSRTRFVADALRHAILTGGLAPGEALVESELAARFGVSKTPVREALKTLAGRGLVQLNEYRGARVRTVDARMARTIGDVRLLLEPEAVRRAVLRGADPEPARRALHAARKASDVAGRSLANRDFHRALYAECGNPVLTTVLDDLRDQAALVSAAAWRTRPTWETEAREHQAILRHAEAGRAAEAARLTQEHIAGFVRRAFPEEAEQ